MLPWDEAQAGSDDIAQLVYLSNLIGADLDLVQPGGGNTSVKREEEDLLGRRVQALVVKGSGTDLRTIDAGGFTHLYADRLATLRERDAMSDEEMMRLMRACMLFAPFDPAQHGNSDPLPSVETPLHALIPQRFVAHTHDVASLSLTDTPSAREHVERVFGADVAFLEYVRPGFPLAKRMAERYADGPPAGTIALAMEKHGVAAWGDTAKECYANLCSVIERAQAYVAERAKDKRVFDTAVAALTPEGRRLFAQQVMPPVRGELARYGWPAVLQFDDSAETLAAISSERFAEVATRGVMTPEHILRCGRRALVLDAMPGATTVRAQHQTAPGQPPIAVNSEDQPANGPSPGAAPLQRALIAQLAAFRDEYLAYAAANGQPNPIPDFLKVIAIPGVGVLYAGKDARNAAIARDCYEATLRAMAGAEAVERFEPIYEADAFEMEYWPLERRKIEESAKSRKPLDGKVALIIGAASGIGRATALRFADAGAHLALVDLDLTRAEEVAASIGDRAFAVAANVVDPEAIAHAFQDAVLRFGGVDVLFYTPGVTPELHPVADMPDAEIAREMDVHFRGAVAATREASRLMLAQGTGGRLIYNASKAAYAPGEGAAAYGAAKAALVHYARNAANELGRHGITANYINADAIDTPLFRALLQERALQSGRTEEEQLQRYADRSVFRQATVPPETVAEAALWLASDAARYTTGCVITVGGGSEGFPR